MLNNLIDLFISNELNDYTRSILITSINKSRIHSGFELDKVEFNRFEVTLDFKNKKVIIEDILDASDLGIVEISLNKFESLIKPELPEHPQRTDPAGNQGIEGNRSQN